MCPPQNDIVLITDYCWRSWTCRIAAPYKFYVDWLIDMPLNISSLIINSASVSLDFTALYKSCFCYFIYLNKVEQETVEQETSILVHVIIFWQHKGHTASYNVQRNENDNCRQIEAATSLIIQMSWAKRFILGQWRLKWTQKDSILEKMQRRLFNTRNPRILRLQSIKFQLSLAWHTAIHGCQKKNEKFRSSTSIRFQNVVFQKVTENITDATKNKWTDSERTQRNDNYNAL